MPLDILPATTGLAADAYARLRRFFAGVGHRPSQEQWDAIRDLMDHLELAANNALPTALHVSAIPAGTGKTQGLASFAQALVSCPAHSGTGMLILVNRVDEAKDMAEVLSAHSDRLCVYTGTPSVSALGQHEVANEAQICVSTQAALKLSLKSLRGPSFADASKYHYLGRRRAVVCWDEAFAFNRPVTLDADTVGGLAGALRNQSNDAVSTLKRWVCDLDACPGGLCSVPDFEGLGVDFRRLEDDVGGQDELVAQAKALAIISGDEGFVTRQGNLSILITHYPEIPASLMPIVVTDASARLNPSYTQMAHRVPLRWLKDAPKTYRNLSIRIVPTSASRTAYRDKKTFRGRDLIDMAGRYIAGVPGEDVLVIGYKGRFGIRGTDQKDIRGIERNDIRTAVEARLKPEDRSRVHYLSYGQHTATNDFKHCKRIILLGLDFKPRAAGHATSGAAQNLNLINDHPTTDQIKEMQDGMLIDSTLQAILRGHARMGVDGDCGTCEVIIPQTKQMGIAWSDYRRMFPEVSIAQDTVLIPSQPLKGRLKELDEIVVRRLGENESEMTNASLYGEMGMDKANFRALAKTPAWQARMAQLGLHPELLSGRMMGLRVLA